MRSCHQRLALRLGPEMGVTSWLNQVETLVFIFTLDGYPLVRLDFFNSITCDDHAF